MTLSQGGADHDVLDDAFYGTLLQRAQQGDFVAVIASPPCTTFSVGRHMRCNALKDGGAKPVRNRDNITGLPGLSGAALLELRKDNTLVDRCVAILTAASSAGSEIVLENPADHGDRSNDHTFMNENHGPLWMYPPLVSFSELIDAELITFPYCALGTPYQKYTSLLVSPGIAPALRFLGELKCDHHKHESTAGGVKAADGTWNSRDTSAWPALLCSFVAQAVAGLIGPSSVGKNSTPPALKVDAPHARTLFKPTLKPPPPATTLPTATASAPPIAHASVPSAGTDLSALQHVVASAIPSAAARLADADESTALPTQPVDRPADAPPPPSSPMKPKRAAVTFAPTSGAQAVRARRGHSRSARGSQLLPQSCPPSSRRLGNTGIAMRVTARSGSVNEIGQTVSSAPLPDPKNRSEAHRQDSPGFTTAEKDEIQSHRSNHSWTEMDRSKLPAGRRLVNFTWAYKRKRSGRLKARLCVQGCSQVPGLDYDQSWCGTMRSPSLRMLSALASRHGLHMHRWDFVTAFLQGSLEPGEVVYCRAPPGYSSKGADGRERIFRVDKPIYGMAQAGRRWQRTLFPWFLEQGFKQLESDSSVFFKARKKSDGTTERLIVGCYVDDLFCLHGGDDAGSLYADFVSSLQSRWKVEDEGPVSDLLNVEFSREPDGTVVLTQQSYIERMVQRYLQSGPTTVPSDATPCPGNIDELVRLAIAAKEAPSVPVSSYAAAVSRREAGQPHAGDEVTLSHAASRGVGSTSASAFTVDPSLQSEYQSIIGSLLYCATNTRPDVAYAVGYLGRAMSCPTPELLECARGVLRYLNTHKSIGLRYAPRDTGAFSGMSDSSWEVRHSTSGSVFMFGEAAITWSSKKQPSVALSSCEAEIMAASEACKELLYLREFLGELGEGSSEPTSLSVDNKAAIDLAYNPEHHQRSKHIERRHFFVREVVESGRLVVPFVASADNLADFFTKPLESKVFFPMRDRIMNVAARSAA